MVILYMTFEFCDRFNSRKAERVNPNQSGHLSGTLTRKQFRFRLSSTLRLYHHAAVGAEDLPNVVFGLRAGQKRHRVGDFL